MKFREWLQLETRYRGLMRQYRNMHPGVPDYILNQMYSNHISPGMNSIMKQQPSGEPIPRSAAPRATHAYYPSEETPQSQAASNTPPQTKNNTIAYTPTTTPSQNSAKPHITNLMQDKDLINGLQWSPKPMVVQLHPLYLEPDSMNRLKFVRFGFAPKDNMIRQDSQRFDTQRQLAAKKPEGQNEPILLVQLGQNYYQILEGYHRSAMYLLQGAPQEDIEALKNGNANVDFGRWKPVKIKAYVGQRQQNQMMPNAQQPYGTVPMTPQPSHLAQTITTVAPNKAA
jgi:hypothetical protein